MSKAILQDGPHHGIELGFDGDPPPYLRMPMYGPHHEGWAPIACYKRAAVTDMGTAIYWWDGQQKEPKARGFIHV